jgi:hypothetical protein
LLCLLAVWSASKCLQIFAVAILFECPNLANLERDYALKMQTMVMFHSVYSLVVTNVCREKGSLLSFVYIFGQMAHQCS